MSLAITIIILLVWAVYSIIQKLTPPDPPIENIDEHLRQLMQCSNQQQRRKFIKADAKRRRNNSQSKR